MLTFLSTYASFVDFGVKMINIFHGRGTLVALGSLPSFTLLHVSGLTTSMGFLALWLLVGL